MRYWFVVVLLCLGLAACGNQGNGKDEVDKGNGDPEKPEPQKPEPVAPTIYVKVDADGTTNMSKLDLPEELAVSAAFGTSDSEKLTTAIRNLRKAAHAAMKQPGIQHTKQGVCNAVLALTVDGAANWRYAQWVLQTTASPGIGIRTVDLSDPRGGNALRIQLPTDQGPLELDEDIARGEPAAQGAAHLKVRVFRRGLQNPPADRFTLIRLADKDFPLPAGPEANQDDAYWDQMRKLNDALKSRIQSQNIGSCELCSPPPTGGSVPYFDVFRVLRMVRDLGIENITLEGAAIPQ